MPDSLTFNPTDHAPHPHHKKKGGHAWSAPKSTDAALKNRLVTIMQECANGDRKTIKTSKNLLAVVQKDPIFSSYTNADLKSALRIPGCTDEELADAFVIRVSYLVAKPVYTTEARAASPASFEYGTDCGCGLVDPE